MDKKLLIGIGLSVATGGLAVAALLTFKTVRKFKVNRERKQMRKYVKKYLGGNKKVLEIVDGLSNFEIRIIFKIFNKTTKKIGEIQFPPAISNKISELMDA